MVVQKSYDHKELNSGLRNSENGMNLFRDFTGFLDHLRVF